MMHVPITPPCPLGVFKSVLPPSGIQPLIVTETVATRVRFENTDFASLMADTAKAL